MNQKFLLIIALLNIGFAYGMEERQPKKRKRIETEQEQREVFPSAKREELQETGFEQWQELPEEVQSLILSFVPEVTDYKSYARLLSMDPQFNKLISDPVFFRAFAIRIADFNPELAKRLLEEGAKADQVNLIATLAAANEDLKKHAEQLLIEAARGGNVKLTRTLLNSQVDPNVKDSQGDPILVLLGSTPAIPRKIVKLLIEHGADVNAQNKEDDLTPLMAAIVRADVRLVEQLLPYADLNLKSSLGQTAVEMAEFKASDREIPSMAIAWLIRHEEEERASQE